MDGWKRGKPYAMVVCPIYQLPRKTSQIYQQAIARNVCIFTYSHLAMLGFSKNVEDLWKTEKQAAIESIAIAKEEALIYLAKEREKIMRMSHEEAL